MHLDASESFDVNEIKQSQSATGRTTDCPNVYAQIFAQLRFLATAFMLKSLKSCWVPPGVSCNGLFLSKSGQMILFTLKIKIGQIDSCELKFESSDVIRPSLPVHSISGSDVCAAITKLLPIH